MKVEKKMLHFKERKKILRKMISTTITTKQRTHDTLMKNKFGFSTLAPNQRHDDTKHVSHHNHLQKKFYGF